MTPSGAPLGSTIVDPSQEDPVVAASIGFLGGPLGFLRRAGSSWWTPIRVLIVLTVVGYVIGYLLDYPCRVGGWLSPDRYEHLCYSDITALYDVRGFADGTIPYLQPAADGTYLEYPVVTGLFMYLASLITSAALVLRPALDGLRTFFDVNVVMLLVPLLVTVVATARTVRRRPWDAAMIALSPLVILGATINWDLLPMMFTALCLLMWSRRSPFAAGVFLGLGVAAKFYPLLLVFGFLLLAIRTRQWRAFGSLLLGGALSWLVVNIPFAIANFEGWSHFYVFNQQRGVDFGSFWYAVDMLGLPGVPQERINLVSGGAFVLLLIGIALLVLRAPRQPRLPAVLFLIVAAFIVTTKIYSPQYVLWLIPLAALARPRWRDFLIWQAGELVYFMAIWWYLVVYGLDEGRGLNDQTYALATLVHIVATLYLAAMVVGDILSPQNDPVRTDGFPEDANDPAGGAFDAAGSRAATGSRVLPN